MRILITVACGLLLLLGSVEDAAGAPLPWNEQSFVAARAKQQPILLTISRASCHECGGAPVDPGNDFVPIELNADEHPRVAAAYSGYARAAGRDVTLPIHLALTPFLDPLGVVGSAEERDVLLTRWRDDRDALIADAGLVLRRLQLSGAASAPWEPADSPLERARAARALLRSPDPDSRQKGLAILRGMAATPLFDHLGGGFHHAARDAAWTMPRFEKLLRDQAEIAIAFIEAWQLAPDPMFEEVARLTLDLIARDFFDVSRRAFAAGLAAAALVPRRGPEVLEGGHYVWRLDEVQQLLGPALGDRVASRLGLRVEGNVPKEFDPRGDFVNRNVFGPLISDDPELQKAVRLLRAARSNRPLHLRDPRVITEYNALAMSALARGAAVFGEPAWVEAAGRAARQYLPSKRIVRSAGIAPTRADLDALVHSLLDLYVVTFDQEFLDRAMAVQREAMSVEPDAEVPDVIRGFLPPVRDVVHFNPSSAERVAAITTPVQSSVRQLVIGGPLGHEQTAAFLRAGRQSFLPPRLVFVLHNRTSRAVLGGLMPWLADVKPIEDQVVATVCQRGACRTLTTDPATVAAWLDGSDSGQVVTPPAP